MKLTEHLDTIGSVRLREAVTAPEADAATRMAAWAVLSLQKTGPLALWDFCEAHDVRGARHPADAILDWHESADAESRRMILQSLRAAKERMRLAAEGHDVSSAPASREYWRGRDFETKVLVAFGGKKEVHERCVAEGTGEARILRAAGTTRKTLQLTFKTGRRTEPVLFRNAGHLLGEYANPDGMLRKNGYSQRHFVDALDRHFAQQQFWKDAYEEPSTVGWMYENGKDDLGRTVYRPFAVPPRPH